VRVQKTSNSKVLISWGHLSGWLDAKSFDFEWPQDVKTFEFEVLGSKNIELKGFNILNSKVFTSWGHLSGWLDAKSFDFGWP
jgi:hypothetical protein